jgi:4-amino-4-deoxy-L-arabinose transferase-like glycosyltransferase
MYKETGCYLLFAVLLINGCSDGSDGWSRMEPDSPAAGIYTPSTFKPSGEAVIIGNSEAIVSPQGQAYLMMHDGPWFDRVIPQSIPFQVSGDTEVEGERFNAPSLRVYPDAISTGQFNIWSKNGQHVCYHSNRESWSTLNEVPTIESA